MSRKSSYIFIVILLVACAAYAQKGRRDGPPRGDGPGKGDWIRGVDTNGDGKVDSAEFQAALVRTFTEVDQNGDGTLQAAELPKEREMRPDGPHRPGDRPGPGPRPNGPPDRGPGGIRQGGPPPQGNFGDPGRPQGPPRRDEQERKLLPPFFFMEASRDGSSIDRSLFDQTAKAVFAQMDRNHDGFLDRGESRPPKQPEGPPPPPNAKFIGAELRFGDKLVKDQPFSAATVIEDTRRLYDGSTVTKSSTGAIYRDGTGRTRREQPLEMVGGFNVLGSDSKPQTLVFINDFASRTQYFLDLNNKVARRQPLGGNPPEPPTPADAKTESLGTKLVEGIACEGTRISFEIPIGEIGNDSPIKVVTENWFSPELQMLVLSRHVDPLAGEHVFKLVNIKRQEPAADLFTVPTGFKVVGGNQKD